MVCKLFMTSLTGMKNFKSLVFVIHSQLMKEKYIAPTGDRTRVLGLTGEDSTTEPPDPKCIQACESYLNIIKLDILHFQVNLHVLQIVLLLKNHYCNILIHFSWAKVHEKGNFFFPARTDGEGRSPE